MANCESPRGMLPLVANREKHFVKRVVSSEDTYWPTVILQGHRTINAPDMCHPYHSPNEKSHTASSLQYCTEALHCK